MERGVTSSEERYLGCWSETHNGNDHLDRWKTQHPHTFSWTQPIAMLCQAVACFWSSLWTNQVGHHLLARAAVPKDQVASLLHSLRIAMAVQGIGTGHCMICQRASWAASGTQSWISSSFATVQSSLSSWGSTLDQDWCSTSSFYTLSCAVLGSSLRTSHVTQCQGSLKEVTCLWWERFPNQSSKSRSASFGSLWWRLVLLLWDMACCQGLSSQKRRLCSSAKNQDRLYPSHGRRRAHSWSSKSYLSSWTKVTISHMGSL